MAVGLFLLRRRPGYGPRIASGAIRSCRSCSSSSSAVIVAMQIAASPGRQRHRAGDGVSRAAGVLSLRRARATNRSSTSTITTIRPSTSTRSVRRQHAPHHARRRGQSDRALSRRLQRHGARAPRHRLSPAGARRARRGHCRSSRSPRRARTWRRRRSPRALAIITNDAFAQSRARSGRRGFSPLATLPLCDPAASVTEFVRAIDELGLPGAMLFSNVNGVGLDRPAVLAALRGGERSRRGADDPPDLSGRRRGDDASTG